MAAIWLALVARLGLLREFSASDFFHEQNTLGLVVVENPFSVHCLVFAQISNRDVPSEVALL